MISKRMVFFFLGIFPLALFQVFLSLFDQHQRKPKGDGGKKKNLTTICDKHHDLRHVTLICDIFK